MIVIGTSGYDYMDWRGYFYPDTLQRKEWLAYYANHFSALELNFTYYRMPSPGQLDSMVERTEGKVNFAVKAHRIMTHERMATETDFREFESGLKELRNADKLLGILAQFPNSFRQCEENRTYIKMLVDRLGLPLVVELRRSEWACDPITKWLANIGVGLCCVDEPQIKGLMPPVATVASGPAYVRFHGRNAANWYNHDNPAQRYDYRYNVTELKEWALKIKKLEKKAGKVLVFFNNHFQAKAVEGAKTMEKLLDYS